MRSIYCSSTTQFHLFHCGYQHSDNHNKNEIFAALYILSVRHVYLFFFPEFSLHADHSVNTCVCVSYCLVTRSAKCVIYIVISNECETRYFLHCSLRYYLLGILNKHASLLSFSIPSFSLCP